MAMSDISELWSQPWHALHRRLADALVVASAPAALLKPETTQVFAPPAGANWLARARSAAVFGDYAALQACDPLRPCVSGR